MTEGERRRIGQRYELFGALATGGTSTVHVGRLHGTAGFVKSIAIKRLHPHLAADPTLRTLLVDEARLVSRISHPNVVAVLDIVEDGGELFLVLEYVHGATLAELFATGERCPPAMAVAVTKDVLTGLHAAHHARDAGGTLLGLVHRDVSPRNIIVTTDGAGKILDFGIAKARARQGTTRDGHVRGSLPYMAPEQLTDEPLTARTDVYGVAVVLWEMLTGERLFSADTEAGIVKKILDRDVRAPSTVVADLPRGLDAVVLRGLARDPEARFASGLEMALALEESLAPCRPALVGAWVSRVADKELARRQALLDAAPEDASVVTTPPVESLAPPVPVATALARVTRAAMIAAAIVLALVTGRALADRSASATTDALPRATAPSTAPPPPSAAAATTPTPSNDRAPVVTAAESTHAPRPSSVVAVSVPRATAKLAPSAASAAPSTLAVDCPPYFVDSTGVRRFNRECLK